MQETNFTFRMRFTGIPFEEYPAYFQFRRKRLNITQVMLIDLLSVSENPDE